MIVQGTQIAKRVNFKQEGLATVVVKGADGTPIAIFIEVGGGTPAECVVMKTAADPDFKELLAINGIGFDANIRKVVLNG